MYGVLIDGRIDVQRGIKAAATRHAIEANALFGGTVHIALVKAQGRNITVLWENWKAFK